LNIIILWEFLFTYGFLDTEQIIFTHFIWKIFNTYLQTILLEIQIMFTINVMLRVVPSNVQ
jgi:hypothetical protein